MTGSIRKRVADLLIGKDTPTGSSLHVPAPMGNNDDEKKKKERRRNIATALGVTKADAVGQYVGRLALNVDQLNDWWQRNRKDREPFLLDPNPHITVAFSRVQFPWSIDRTILAITPDDTQDIGLLGPKNAVVLFLHSPILDSRWQAARDAGATWDYNGYRPHLTLFYLGADADVTTFRKIVPPDFPIILGQELQSTTDLDVFEAVKAPEWYQAARGVRKDQPVHVTVNVAPPAVTIAPAAAPHVNVTVEAAPQAGRRVGKISTNAEGQRVVEITDAPADVPTDIPADIPAATPADRELAAVTT
jgi:hypothetical protein